MAFLAGKRIAVAGAGIAGTAFALALEQACRLHRISPMPVIQLFERDASATARAGLGYSLSLRNDSGLAGLTVVHQLQRGIAEDLKTLQEPANGVQICTEDFNPVVSMSDHESDDRKLREPDWMRISRSCLRETMLARINPQNIQYGKVSTSAKSSGAESGPLTLGFSDGSNAECDLLVVADGASSKLRESLLPKETLNYAGVTSLYGRTGRLDQLPKQLLEGHPLLLSSTAIGGFMCSVERETVMWSLSFKAPQPRAAELNALFKDPAAAQEFLRQEVPKLAAGFTEPFPSMLRVTPPSSLIAIPAQDKLPHPMHDGRIVYIGDAWHAMSPFSGSGANMALADAWEVAQQLVEGGHKDAAAAISAFAAQNAARSAGAIKSSRRIISLVHSEGLTKWLFVTFLKLVGRILGVSGAITALIRWSRR